MCAGTCGDIAGVFCADIAGRFCGVAAAETGARIGCGVAKGVGEELLATFLGLSPKSSEKDGNIYHNDA